MSALRLACVAFLAATAVLAATPARAERCDATDVAVGLVFEGDWPPGRQGAVVAELRAALEAQELVLCLELQSDAPALASLHLVGVSETAIRLEVWDRLTAKRVERELDVEELPEGSRALAIAVAADELLRASWAELVLIDAPETAVVPPPPVRAMVERERDAVVRETEPPREPRYLQLGGQLRAHLGGALMAGAELRVEIGVHPRIAIALVGEAARVKTIERAPGSIDGLSLRGGLDLGVSLLGSPRGLQLVGTIGARAGWARFSGHASDQATTAQGDATAATASARLGLEGRAHFGALQLRLATWVGVALAGVNATIDGEGELGTQGVELGLTLGLGVRL